MPVLSFVNLKGGVGKTSCTLHLGAALAQAGHRVLLVDNDPQSSLTSGLLGPAVTRQLNPAETVHAVLAGQDPYPEQVIRPTSVPGLHLLPGSRHAVRFNVPEPHLAPYEEQVRLAGFLGPVMAGYDLGMIDCPPNLHMASWAAMAASSHLVCPVMPEDFGCQGTADVAECAALARAVVNPGLVMLGYVVSMFNSRRTGHRLYVETMRAGHGDAVFATMIPHAADFADAIGTLRPVTVYKPKGTAARAVRALAVEVLERLDTASAVEAGEAA
jgi:chromosome partitioning protein